MIINGTVIILVIALMVVLYLIARINKNDINNNLNKYFGELNILLVIYLVGLILQIMFSEYSIKPIYFDYITYIGITFIPVMFFAISQEYKGGKKLSIKLLCIIPILTLLILWTSDWHHLFYKVYSTNINDTVYGPYLYIHMIYSYGLMLVAFINIIVSSIKKSGFLSTQTGLIIFGALAPVIPNVLGTLKVISMSIYVTPMMFTVSAICFYIAIFKLKALNITPVTLKTIINSMSDAFVVISEDGTIADINKTFIDTFKDIAIVKNKDNFFKLIEETGIIELEGVKKDILATREKNGLITKEYHIQKDGFDKYFEIDCQPIKAKSGNEYVAYLILIRDITAAKRDMEIMTKNENLVILGELAGGVAHDINTPISAIKSGLLMLKETAKTEDEKMLVTRMDSCADKIVNLVNSLRNQIRNIGGDDKTNIVMSAIINDIKLIIHNELTKSNVTLNVDLKEDLTILGNYTKLSQVITNIVMNAIQAYEGKPGVIGLSVYKSEKNEAIVRIEDHAGGIPASVRPYIFKNILTTKGVSGTGFGLYLAYSVIKGSFGGEILFDTKDGEGTVFYIVIPL